MLQSSVNLLIYAPQIKGALSIKCNKGRKGTLLGCKKHVLKWLILYIGLGCILKLCMTPLFLTLPITDLNKFALL